MQYGGNYYARYWIDLLHALGDLLEIGTDGLRFWICLPSADDPIVALRVRLLGRLGLEYSSNFSVSFLDK